MFCVLGTAHAANRQLSSSCRPMRRTASKRSGRQRREGAAEATPLLNSLVASRGTDTDRRGERAQLTLIESAEQKDDLRVLTIDLSRLTNAELDTVLTQGLAEIARAITDATRNGLSVAIDLRSAGTGSRGRQEAVIQAVRGLIQSYTLETRHPVLPVNVVLSETSQSSDRDATWRYLADADGAMARGATFDLRIYRP